MASSTEKQEERLQIVCLVYWWRPVKSDSSEAMVSRHTLHRHPTYDVPEICLNILDKPSSAHLFWYFNFCLSRT